MKVAYLQMKMVAAAALLLRYWLRVVEGQVIEPKGEYYTVHGEWPRRHLQTEKEDSGLAFEEEEKGKRKSFSHLWNDKFECRCTAGEWIILFTDFSMGLE